MLLFPVTAAKCNGVKPSLAQALGSTPSSRILLTPSRSPSKTALKSEDKIDDSPSIWEKDVLEDFLVPYDYIVAPHPLKRFLSKR